MWLDFRKGDTWAEFLLHFEADNHVSLVMELFLFEDVHFVWNIETLHAIYYARKSSPFVT
jgi:hypothetical protein